MHWFVSPVMAMALRDTADSADAASSRLSMAITALLALAVIIAVSTAIFWRLTRPDSLNVGEVGIRWIQPDAGAEAPSAAEDTGDRTAPRPERSAPPLQQSGRPERD